MAEPDTSNTTISARFGQMFPVLEPRDIERLRRFGTAEIFAAGTRIVKAGEVSPGLIVLLSGKVEVSNDDGLGKREVIVTHMAGQFMGELAQLSARPSLVDADVVEDVEGFIITSDRLRDVLVQEAVLGERIMRALILRRVGLLETRRGGPIIIGRSDNADVLRLRGVPDAQRPAPARAGSGQGCGRRSADRALPHRRPPLADRALPEWRAAAQSRRERACALPRAGAAHRCRQALRRGDRRRRSGRTGRCRLCRLGGAVDDRARLPRLRRPGGRLGPHRELSRLSDRNLRPGADGARLQPGAEIRRRDGDPRRGASASRSNGELALSCLPSARARRCGRAPSSSPAARATGVSACRNLAQFEGVVRPLLGLAHRGASSAPGRRSRWSAPAIPPARRPSISPARSTRSGCSSAAPTSAQRCRTIWSSASRRSPTSRSSCETEVTCLEGEGDGLSKRTLAQRRNRSGNVPPDPPPVPVHRRRPEHRLAGQLRRGARSPRALSGPAWATSGITLETNRAGVFAIGDVRSGSVKRVASAVGEGAQVVAAIHQFLAAEKRRVTPNRRRSLMFECRHAEQIKDVVPSALGCEECLKTGSPWVHLRLCRTCGHVGCCDNSPNRHATAHFHATRHPDHRGLRSAGRLGLVLCRRTLHRSRRQDDAPARSHSEIHLNERLARRSSLIRTPPSIVFGKHVMQARPSQRRSPKTTQPNCRQMAEKALWQAPLPRSSCFSATTSGYRTTRPSRRRRKPAGLSFRFSFSTNRARGRPGPPAAGGCIIRCLRS